jgi:hypothetical protein
VRGREVGGLCELLLEWSDLREACRVDRPRVGRIYRFVRSDHKAILKLDASISSRASRLARRVLSVDNCTVTVDCTSALLLLLD